MKSYFSVTCILSLLLFSCGVKVPEDTPKCIEDIINEFVKTANCPESSVTHYTWGTDSYYVISDEACCCDQQSFWYDENCNLVCTTGGIAPSVNVCDLQLDSLTFVETIWKKN